VLGKFVVNHVVHESLPGLHPESAVVQHRVVLEKSFKFLDRTSGFERDDAEAVHGPGPELADVSGSVHQDLRIILSAPGYSAKRQFPSSVHGPVFKLAAVHGAVLPGQHPEAGHLIVLELPDVDVVGVATVELEDAETVPEAVNEAALVSLTVLPDLLTPAPLLALADLSFVLAVERIGLRPGICIGLAKEHWPMSEVV